MWFWIRNSLKLPTLKIRKILFMLGVLQPNFNIIMFYIKRSDKVRGRISLDHCVEDERTSLSRLFTVKFSCNIQQHKWALMQVKWKGKKNSSRERGVANMTNDWAFIDNLKYPRKNTNAMKPPRNGSSTGIWIERLKM